MVREAILFVGRNNILLSFHTQKNIYIFKRLDFRFKAFSIVLLSIPEHAACDKFLTENFATYISPWNQEFIMETLMLP